MKVRKKKRWSWGQFNFFTRDRSEKVVIDLKYEKPIQGLLNKRSHGGTEKSPRQMNGECIKMEVER